MQSYNEGNLRKYQTQNPIKRSMINNLHERISEELIINISNENDKVSVLDAGCGEGFLTKYIRKKHPALDITGVECMDEALGIAMKQCPEVNFVKGDITHLEYQAEKFDMTVCSEVLEHIERPELALEELLRVTKRVLIITVPYEPWFRILNLLALNHIKTMGNPIDHINHWTKETMKKFIDDRLLNYRARGGMIVASYKVCFPWIMCVIKKC